MSHPADKHIDPPQGWQDYDCHNLAIRGARLFDPGSNVDMVSDITIRDGKIYRIGPLPNDFEGDVIDGRGLIVCPGLFDMHVHLREPGYEHKETIKSGCFAAVAGGFTGVAPMPNTNPPTDSPAIVNFIREQAVGIPVDVHPIGAITAGRKGEKLAEMDEMHSAGVTGFSDDGSPVSSAGLLRLALEYAMMSDSVIIEHCEETSLSGNGVMDEGAVSTELGLPGWPSIAEEIGVYTCIRLAEYTGGRIHIAHLSTAGSVELVRKAKARGVNVTAETTPQHLTLDCSILEGYDSNYKVNPPLRTNADIQALIEGLTDGTIDAIATDHAPHAPDEKEVEFTLAPFGMTGLETALGVVLTKLVETKKISMARAIDALSIAPRRILNLPVIKIEPGESANLTIFNPSEKWTVDKTKMLSKSRNTPFNGWELTGRSVGVINKNVAWIRRG